MSEPDVLRVLAYVRQSKGREGESEADSLSLDAQAKAIAKLCEERGWELADVIRDHDLKGDDPHRPGLTALMKRAPAVDAVAVFALSRLARDNLLQETAWRQLRQSGTRLVSVTEPAAEDDLVRGILGVVSQEERKRMGKFISHSLRTKQERGNWVGRVPFGYRYNAEHRIEPDPETAPIVQRIAGELLAGRRHVDIVTDLLADGIYSPNGSVWITANFRAVMTNPALAGLLRTRRDGTLIPGAFDPILDRATWEAVCASFTRGRRIRTKPLSSFAEGCVEHSCGSRMYMFATELKDRTNPSLFRVFRCKQYRAIGHRCSEPHREVSANRIEWAARQCLAIDLGTILSVSDARSRWNGANTTNLTERRRMALVKRQATAQDKHRKARDRWFEGVWSDALMDEADQRLKTKLAEIESELAALPVEPDWSAISSFAAELDGIDQAIAGLPDAELGALLRRLGVLIWSGETATVRYHPLIALRIPHPAVLSVPKRVA